ncbi:MAG: RHS repeat-associated core domain-containing protein [Sedimentisphaerales bacterium]|nr:RHS repeat-associated core domain-containing protein [Sedimentisphaerales bacterium]
MYHFLFRSYSPRLGRWLQRDPIGYVDGVNMHEYVGSSPVGWLDPLGLTRLGEEWGGEVSGNYVKHERSDGSKKKKKDPADEGLVEKISKEDIVESEPVPSQTTGKATGKKTTDRGYWRVDYENGRESGNIHVVFKGKKWYWDPEKNVFRNFETGNLMGKSQLKRLNKTKGIRDSLRKALKQIQEKGQRNFRVSPKAFRKLTAAAGALAGFILSVDALSDPNVLRAYGQLMGALQNGNVDGAYRFAEDFSLAIGVNQADGKVAMAWLLFYENVLEPALAHAANGEK